MVARKKRSDRRVVSGLVRAEQRIFELERVLRRVVSAECDVERESALIEARHTLAQK